MVEAVVLSVAICGGLFCLARRLFQRTNRAPARLDVVIGQREAGPARRYEVPLTFRR